MQTEGSKIAACHADTITIRIAKFGGSKNPAWFGKRQRIKSPEPELLRRANAALIADRQFVAAFCTTAREHLTAVGGFHAFAKAVGLSALSVVRLKSTFGHGNPYLGIQKQVETYRARTWQKTRCY